MRKKQEMKVVFHIGPDFEKRKEIAYGILLDFLRKEIEKNPKAFAGNEEPKRSNDD